MYFKLMHSLLTCWRCNVTDVRLSTGWASFCFWKWLRPTPPQSEPAVNGKTCVLATRPDPVWMQPNSNMNGYSLTVFPVCSRFNCVPLEVFPCYSFSSFVPLTPLLVVSSVLTPSSCTIPLFLSSSCPEECFQNPLLSNIDHVSFSFVGRSLTF